MTQKDFIALADVLRAQYNRIERYPNAVVRTVALNTFMRMYNELTDMCQRQNAKFKSAVFHKAVFGGSR